MKRFALFGPTAELTPVARMIMEEDLAGLDHSLGRAWRVNSLLQMTNYIDELPINLALIENKLRVVDYLLENGAYLNLAGFPAITSAVRNCDLTTIDKLLDAGADINARDSVGKNAMACLLYDERYDLIEPLAGRGLTVNDGITLRHAAWRSPHDVVALLLSLVADPNLSRPDSVFPDNPTPLNAAARRGRFDVVRLLVEHGADVAIPDALGWRPYLQALRNGDAPMMDYLRALEPAHLHDPSVKAELLRQSGAPEALIEFLAGEGRTVETKSAEVPRIGFQALADIREFCWEDLHLIDLASYVENYTADGFVAWSSAHGKLVSVDIEHAEVVELSSWEAFVSDPGRWLDEVIDPPR